MTLLLALQGGTTHAAAVAFTGTGTSAYSATALRAASVAFSGAGTFASQATVNRAAVVAFGGAATVAASASVVPAVVPVGGGGPARPVLTNILDFYKPPKRRPVLHRASVAFRTSSEFRVGRASDPFTDEELELFALLVAADVL